MASFAGRWTETRYLRALYVYKISNIKQYNAILS